MPRDTEKTSALCWQVCPSIGREKNKWKRIPEDNSDLARYKRKKEEACYNVFLTKKAAFFLIE